MIPRAIPIRAATNDFLSINSSLPVLNRRIKHLSAGGWAGKLLALCLIFKRTAQERDAEI
jgi:hypothetical protein